MRRKLQKVIISPPNMEVQKLKKEFLSVRAQAGSLSAFPFAKEKKLQVFRIFFGRQFHLQYLFMKENFKR
jgi:hypothetical protein